MLSTTKNNTHEYTKKKDLRLHQQTFQVVNNYNLKFKRRLHSSSSNNLPRARREIIDRTAETEVVAIKVQEDVKIMAVANIRRSNSLSNTTSQSSELSSMTEYFPLHYAHQTKEDDR